MSAYICNPEQIGVLAAFAIGTNMRDALLSEFKTGKGQIADAVNCAKQLATANIDSIKARYPDDKNGCRPGPGLFDDEIVELSGMWAEFFVTRGVSLSPASIYRMAKCFDYQACEVENYELSLAARQISCIKDKAAEALPGYPNAIRDFSVPLDLAPKSVLDFYAALSPQEV